MKKEWKKPEIEILDVSLTMHNSQGCINGKGHDKDIGKGHDEEHRKRNGNAYGFGHCDS